MSQDIINNRFLEESVFAIADGYCVINLSKNIEWPPFLSPWLPTVSFLPYPVKWTACSHIPFMFRTISLWAAFFVFYTHLLIPPFPGCTQNSYWFSPSWKKTSLLLPRLTSVCSALLWVVVTLFKAFHTDLPGYHTFLSLHLSATFIPHNSV